MSIEVQESQDSFLRDGGTYRLGLAYHRKNGTLPKSYTYQEYPKMIRLSDGVKTFDCSTLTCDKQTVTWKEEREVFRDIVVNDETEEERVLSGGKTSVQIEQDRQSLILKCSAAGIRVDPTWTAVRLRRELGERMDAPEPTDKMGALEAELANLRKMAAMQAEIDALKAQMSTKAAPDTDETDQLRADLTGLGVVIDKRWGVSRMREELERATASVGD